MDFSDLSNVLEMINIGLESDFRDQMTVQSFGAWQITETIKGMFDEKAKGTTFNDYAKRLGLLDEEKPKESKFSKIANKALKAQALNTAEEILRIDRGQKE